MRQSRKVFSLAMMEPLGVTTGSKSDYSCTGAPQINLLGHARLVKSFKSSGLLFSLVQVNIVSVGTVATEIELASLDNVLATNVTATLLAAKGVYVHSPIKLLMLLFLYLKIRIIICIYILFFFFKSSWAA